MNYAKKGCSSRICSDSGLLLHTEWRGRSVCVSVCVSVLVTFMSQAKTAETIEMPFGG